MSDREHRAYWQWRIDAGGGYDEILILSLYDDSVELIAHVDYHRSRDPRRWSLDEARRAGREDFEAIPDGAWEDLRARLG